MSVEAQSQRGNLDARSPSKIAENRAWFNSLVPWQGEPAKNELHQSSGGETTVYEKSNRRTARKIVGETLYWGGGAFAVWNAVTLDLGGFVGSAAAHIAGRWIRPKEGQ